MFVSVFLTIVKRRVADGILIPSCRHSVHSSTERNSEKPYKDCRRKFGDPERTLRTARAWFGVRRSSSETHLGFRLLEGQSGQFGSMVIVPSQVSRDGRKSVIGMSLDDVESAFEIFVWGLYHRQRKQAFLAAHAHGC